MSSAAAITLNQSPNWETTLPSHKFRKLGFRRRRSRYSFIRLKFWRNATDNATKGIVLLCMVTLFRIVSLSDLISAACFRMKASHKRRQLNRKYEMKTQTFYSAGNWSVMQEQKPRNQGAEKVQFITNPGIRTGSRNTSNDWITTLWVFQDQLPRSSEVTNRQKKRRVSVHSPLF